MTWRSFTRSALVSLQRFFGIMEPPDPNLPDMGVLAFEHVKTYD
jgi:hypothetical protein